jgi:toxin HigB-1
MEVRFADASLDRLETDLGYTAGHPPEIVRVFRLRMQTIRAAADERAFYALKSLHYEKLKGKRAHQHSMRLNRQWRLIVEFDESGPSKVVCIVAIEDYH